MRFVCVHLGAGFHHPSKDSQNRRLMKKALQAGLSCPQEATALQLVEAMIRILEQDPHTNTGVGSNLNLEGGAECDAAIMSTQKEQTLFGAIGTFATNRFIQVLVPMPSTQFQWLQK